MRHRPVRLAAATLLILSGAMLGGCQKGQSTEALLAEARLYQQKGNKNGALIQAKNAVEQAPDNVEARLLLATLYNDLRDPVSAEKEARKALSLKAAPERAVAILATALLSQSKFQQVLDATQSEDSQKQAAVLALRGRAYMALKQLDKAKAAFDQALKLDPASVGGLTGMAGYALATDEEAEAGRYSQQAIDTNPASIDARFFKAELLRGQGKVVEAQTAYDEVLKLDPSNAIAHLLKAHVAIGAKQFDAAKAEIDAARKASPKLLAAHYAQGRLEYTQGKYAAAMEALLQVLRASPKDPPSLLMASAAQFALGSMAQAETYLKSYLEIDPDLLYARKLMAAIRIRTGQAQDALAVLQAPLRAEVQDLELYTLAGEAALRAKNYSKATQYFEHASKMAPDASKPREGLALSVLGLGDQQRAVGELEKATRLDPQSAQSGVLLVMTRLRLNELDNAMLAAKAFAKAQPSSPIAPYLIGVIQVAKKDPAAARLSFQQALVLQPTYFEPVEQLAQLDLLESKPEAAKARYLAFLQHDKKHVEVMNSLAKLALAMKQPAEALQWLERARDENPDSAAAGVTLAGHHLYRGDPKKALTMARTLLTSHPGDVNVLDLLGLAQNATGDLTGAVESYSKLAALRSSSALAQYRLAQAYLAVGNLGAAASALKNALAMKPDYYDALQTMVLTETRRAHLDQAIVHARQLQKKYPKLAPGFVLEGDVQMLKKQPDAAAKAYAQGYAVRPSGVTVSKLHDALIRSGKQKDADAMMARFQASHPKDVDSHMYLGGVALAAKQHAVAEQHYRAILQIEPNHASALNNLAWTLQQEKNPAALGYAEQAFKLVPEPNATLLDTLGWILVEQGNTARGVPLLRKALSLDPSQQELRYRLAIGLVKSGDKLAARKELEQLLLASKEPVLVADAQALLKTL